MRLIEELDLMSAVVNARADLSDERKAEAQKQIAATRAVLERLPAKSIAKLERVLLPQQDRVTVH